MAAPFQNQNHLKYPPDKAKEIFRKAVKALKKNDQLFNDPSLHRAIGLKL